MPSTRARAVIAVGLAVKPVGKPDAGNPHVRFDERGRETGCCRMAQATAPVLDSTCAPTARITSGGSCSTMLFKYLTWRSRENRHSSPSRFMAVTAAG
jgi:hypothetical protein